MVRLIFLSLALSFWVSASGATEPVSLDDLQAYERDQWSREATQCDRLAGHPNDPERVGEGVVRPEIDLEAAITACSSAVAADPDNPRLNYQLARVYGYSGRHEESDPYRKKALVAGYPQSLFVIGYIRLEGWDGRGKDPCYGGELIRRSALAGRYAGLVGFPHYALSGQFDECGSYPKVDKAELQLFLDQAEEQSDDFYKGLLVANLKARLQE